MDIREMGASVFWLRHRMLLGDAMNDFIGYGQT
jgi:hypothetical protein